MSPVNDRIEIYPSTVDGQLRWRRVAANNEILASGQPHRDVTDAKRAARRACPDVPDDQYVVLQVGDES